MEILHKATQSHSLPRTPRTTPAPCNLPPNKRKRGIKTISMSFVIYFTNTFPASLLALLAYYKLVKNWQHSEPDIHSRKLCVSFYLVVSILDVVIDKSHLRRWSYVTVLYSWEYTLKKDRFCIMFSPSSHPYHHSIVY